MKHYLHLKYGGTPVESPEVILPCCHCRRPQPISEMVEETNPESPVFGYLSCNRDTCFEGGNVTRAEALTPKIEGPEDMAPYKNHKLWS